jgi:hypothetical protein
MKQGRAINIKEHNNEIWGSVVAKLLGTLKETLPQI